MEKTGRSYNCLSLIKQKKEVINLLFYYDVLTLFSYHERFYKDTFRRNESVIICTGCQIGGI